MTQTQTQTAHSNGGKTTAAEVETTRNGYRPLVDIVEHQDELQLIADMPGVSAESIDIDFEDGALTILGRVPQGRDDDAKFVRQEYGIGDFYRVFQVGEAVDPTRISADYSNGVLTVHLPKVETVKPRKISVQAK